MTAANQLLRLNFSTKQNPFHTLLLSLMTLVFLGFFSTSACAFDAVTYEGELDLGDDVRFVSQWEISQDGRFLFAYLISGMRVVSFHRDPETGHLAPVDSLAINVRDTRGIEIRLSADGQFLYLAGDSLNTIQQIAIDQDSGSLSLIDPEALRLEASARVFNMLIRGQNLYLAASVSTPETGYGRIYHVEIEPGSGALTLRDELIFPNGMRSLFSPPGTNHLYATENISVVHRFRNQLYLLDLQEQGFMGEPRLALEQTFHPLVSRDPVMSDDGKFFYAIGLMNTDPPINYLLTFERDAETGLMSYRERPETLTRLLGEDQIVSLLDGQMFVTGQGRQTATYFIHERSGSVQRLRNNSPQQTFGYRVFIADRENKFLYAAHREGVSLFRINGLPTAIPQQVPALSHWAVVALLFMVGFFGLLCQRFRRRDDEIVL